MNLKQWRSKKGLSVQEAVDMLGLSQPTISRIERGVQLPGPKTISLLSEKSGGAITGADLFKAWESARESV